MAAETYKGEPVKLRGSDAFIEKAITSIVEFNLDIKLDEETQKYLTRKLEEEANERRAFRLAGGKYIKRRATQKHDPGINNGRGRTLSQPLSLTPPTLRTLPKRSMDNPESRNNSKFSDRYPERWCYPAAGYQRKLSCSYSGRYVSCRRKRSHTDTHPVSRTVLLL